MSRKSASKKSVPAGCHHDYVGEINEGDVTATTDALGSDVVVKGPDVHKLAAFPNHAEALAAAKKVVKEGMTSLTNWRDPLGDTHSFIFALVSAQMSRGGFFVKKTS